MGTVITVMPRRVGFDKKYLNRMEENKKLAIEEKIVAALKTVYDPEIPVNIYDLGLIYKVDYHEEDGTLDVDMTLTAPGCPLADYIVEDVRQKLVVIDGVTTAVVNLVFEPEWTQDMMSEEAKADLGFL